MTIASAQTTGIVNYEQLARQIAASLIFSEIKTLPIAEQWRQKFSNARLTYMDSYYSAGGSYEGYNTGGATVPRHRFTFAPSSTLNIKAAAVCL